MAANHSSPSTTTTNGSNGARSSSSAAAAAAASQSSNEGKIRAAHLLVKHRDSRRPSSWREAEITRSKEDARDIIQAHEQRIKSGETTLGELALTESDCSSARKRGDLGFFGRGDMVREFEDTAFGLDVGEVSGVVDGPSGLHLIERYVHIHISEGKGDYVRFWG